MSLRPPAGFIRPGYNPLEVPDAPTIGTASSASGTSVSVAFTAPANVGGSAITGYVAVVTDSSSGAQFNNSGASSPITVSGLTAGNTYTCKVFATNSYGPSLYSLSSNEVVPVAAGQEAYTTAGTYSWVVPAGVTSVSAVVVGGGGGGDTGNGIGWGGLIYGTGKSGAGAGLAYANNISVTPGEVLTVVVGAGGSGGTSYLYNRDTSTYLSTPTASTSGSESSFKRSSTNLVRATGGANLNGTPGSAATGTGFSGGFGANGNGQSGSGGGGAAGYSGNGGNGGLAGNNNATAGSGGGGGGGGATSTQNVGGGGGGGVGILGEGSSGIAGTLDGGGGYGGSGGGFGGSPAGGQGGGIGGTYGAGGGSGFMWEYLEDETGSRFYIVGSGGNGGVGAVRIIWPGTTRSFPSTNTGNL